MSEKLCVYVGSEIKRRLMHLRADTKKDMSDLAELALQAFFELIENGEFSVETRERIKELRERLARLRAELAAPSA